MGMTRRSSILASDSDRERVAERLRQAATEGRILAHELEERVARALRARTYGELDALVADLPHTATPTKRRSGTLSLARSHPVAAVIVLVTVTLALVMVAAMLAFSGVWLLLPLLVFARGGWYRSGRSGGFRRPPTGSRRGPYWVP
jgi:hypothetical protein